MNGCYIAAENRNLKDKDEIEKAIKLGEYIRNGASPWWFYNSKWAYHCLERAETLALYSLRKYRHLKRMYPEDSVSDPFHDDIKKTHNKV